MLEAIATEVKSHPAWIFAAVAIVALLAYLQSQNQPQVVEAGFAGGGAARSLDPGAVAIEQAAIGAGQANVSTLASLIAQENGNQAALFGSVRQTDATRDTSLASTEAGRQVSLASISAALRASLASTEAQQEVADAQTAAGVTIAQNNNAASVQAASINSQSAREISQINAATEAARIRAEQAVNQSQQQTTKDIARAQDNTSIFTEALHVGESLLAYFL